MFGMSKKQKLVKAAEAKKPVKVDTEEILANMAKCVNPADTVIPSLLFVAGGVSLAGTSTLLMKQKEEIKPVELGIMVTLSAGAITAGAIMNANMAKKANQQFDIMTGIAAREAKAAQIFGEIIASDMCRGEGSFMKIVDCLAGVSDADKENLRKRYREYAEAQVHAAARNATNAVNGTSAPQQQTAPIQPEQPIDPTAAAAPNPNPQQAPSQKGSEGSIFDM